MASAGGLDGRDGTTPRETSTLGEDDVDVGTGGTAFGTPNRQGMSTSSSSPQQPPRWGLAEAVQEMIDKSSSPNLLVRELRRQSAIRDNYGDTRAQNIWNDFCGDPWTLRIFATMKEGSSRIRLLWGVGKFHDVEGTGDVSSDVLAFAGNRDPHGHNPPMVSLPVQNSYKWADVRGDFADREEYEAYYGNADNKYKLRPLPSTTSSNVVDRKLPRLLHLPYELGLFAARTPGMTAFELYEEAQRLVNDEACPATADDLELVLDWCVAAAYESSQNSVLMLKTKDATSDLPAFVDFKQKKYQFSTCQF